MQNRFRKKPVGTRLRISCVHFLLKDFFFISDIKKGPAGSRTFFDVKPEISD